MFYRIFEKTNRAQSYKKYFIYASARDFFTKKSAFTKKKYKKSAPKQKRVRTDSLGWNVGLEPTTLGTSNPFS